MQESDQQLTLEELARLLDIPVRTIRYYITEGLVPGSGTRGKAATYGEEHILRLRLIRRLAERHMPLAAMQDLTPRLSLEEVRTLLEEEDRRARELERSAQQSSVKEYVEQLLENAQEARKKTLREQSEYNKTRGMPPSTPVPPPASFPDKPFEPLPLEVPLYTSDGESWRRWELASGVELHIRSDAESRQRGLIERLFRAAGKLFRPSY